MMYIHADISCNSCGAYSRCTIKATLNSANNLMLEVNDNQFGCERCGNTLLPPKPVAVIDGQMHALDELFLVQEITSLREQIRQLNMTITDLVTRCDEATQKSHEAVEFAKRVRVLTH